MVLIFCCLEWFYGVGVLGSKGFRVLCFMRLLSHGFKVLGFGAFGS